MKSLPLPPDPVPQPASCSKVEPRLHQSSWVDSVLGSGTAVLERGLYDSTGGEEEAEHRVGDGYRPRRDWHPAFYD